MLSVTFGLLVKRQDAQLSDEMSHDQIFLNDDFFVIVFSENPLGKTKISLPGLDVTCCHHVKLYKSGS